LSCQRRGVRRRDRHDGRGTLQPRRQQARAESALAEASGKRSDEAEEWT
jgi:hypothetical protein